MLVRSSSPSARPRPCARRRTAGALHVLAATLCIGLLAAQPDWRRVTIGPGRMSALFHDGSRILGFGSRSGVEFGPYELRGNAWTRVPGSDPPVTFPAALGYDPERDRVVIVSGTLIYEWDGSGWTQAGTLPHVYADLVLVYDSVRRVMFGYGRPPQSWMTDSFHWDGTSVALNPSGPRKFAAGIGYDSTRGRVILFGGSDSPGNDTWEFDGVSWSRPRPVVQPPRRLWSSLVHDPATGLTLLIGGRFSSSARTDTWGWDGTTWHPLPGLDLRRLHMRELSLRPAVAYDPVARGVVLSDWDTTTWRSSNGQWTRIAGAHLPLFDDADLAFDHNLGSLVCYSYDQLMRFAGSRWLPVGTTAPGARRYARLSTDVGRGRVVLFGGGAFAGDPVPRGTWEWEGAAWQQRATAAEPAWRMNHAMVCDEFARCTVLFGGQGQGEVDYADTWLYDGTAWRLASPATVPPARSKHGMAYDRRRGRVVMYGGTPRFGTPWFDTWEWDGSDWIRVGAASEPRIQSGRTLAYDQLRDVTVLFGVGQNGVQQTWTWNGTEWRQLETANNPTWSLGFPVWPFAYDVQRELLFASDRFELVVDPVGSVTPFGTGCPGQAGVPQLREVAGSRPVIGQVLQLEVSGIRSADPVLGILGVSRTQHLGFPLPLDLTRFGLPGCSLYVSIDIVDAFPGAGAPRQWSIPIPQVAQLIGYSVFGQAFVADTTANGIGVFSNAVDCHVGVR